MLKYDKGKLRNFPHVYYVNLDNRTDRKEYMEKQFEFWRLDFTRVSSSKYAASKAKEWGADKVTGKVTGMPAYVVGNAVTHLEFMKDWLNTSTDPWLLLMEDDYDLNLFQYWNFNWDYLMNRIPYDWDCLQIGYESTKFIPFFLHPKLNHTYFGPVILQRDYVEKILDLHSDGDKWNFEKVLGDKKFNKSAGTVDYFIGHTGRTYCIPLITTNDTLTSGENGVMINRIHHKHSRRAYYHWWMTQHKKFSLDDFFTYGKVNDHKMIISTIK
jgi:hypothetical protein|tara:strand:+ start:212 stop:1021 length:810 start_codon:yes stop_codon:yes gene_type:complete